MSLSDWDKFAADNAPYLAQIINTIPVGIWELNVDQKEFNLSAGFYTILGYEPGEIPCTYDYFLEHLLYHDDRADFTNAVSTRNGQNAKRTVHFRLLTKNSGYHWFESPYHVIDHPSNTKVYGSIININEAKLIKLQAAKNDFLYSEGNKITSIGTWAIDVKTFNITLSKEIYEVFELNNPVKMSIEETTSFFEPEYRPILSAAIDAAIRYCRPYELEMLLRTAKNNVIWVRAKGRPVIDDYGRCEMVTGTFQNIDTIKRKEITLQAAIDELMDQNKRLQNFAHIVSHNLRTHAGNLKSMVSLYDGNDNEDDHKEIFTHIRSISNNLNTTIEHLNEIVKTQTEPDKERKLIQFETLFKNILSLLESNIVETETHVEYDFSNCPEIKYIPAYLESILLNLLTNAIKYKHPDRAPQINCYTFRERKNIFMVFEDNGRGIDLALHGSKVFGMYKTFHKNTDARGIGLFITRNQVEALGGSISVESTVNVGTKFTVRLV